MYTTNERGQLNAYPVETPFYYAEYPSPNQQRRYAFWGGVATLLVAAAILTAFSVG